ncbi:MAG: response regulator [Treponema sp.]|jgi:excisionase family DNA binding protein|nr:response regulator [Treponema sp.]
MSKEFEKTIVYSALEVANICGVANQTAINWIRNGYLKAYSTPGGQYRVYADDLVGFMMERNMRVPENLASLCNTSSNSSILVVEDDMGLNTVLHQYLSKEFSGVQVYQAFDGFEAGSLMTSKKPTVVVLDLNLPGVDGFELCKKINSSDEFGNPAIIVITALQDSGIEDKIQEMHAVAFFRKPVVLDELSQAVKAAFSKVSK